MRLPDKQLLLHRCPAGYPAKDSCRGPKVLRSVYLFYMCSGHLQGFISYYVRITFLMLPTCRGRKACAHQ